MQQEAWLALIEAKPENCSLISVVIRGRLARLASLPRPPAGVRSELDTADSETVHEIAERRERG